MMNKALSLCLVVLGVAVFHENVIEGSGMFAPGMMSGVLNGEGKSF